MLRRLKHDFEQMVLKISTVENSSAINLKMICNPLVQKDAISSFKTYYGPFCFSQNVYSMYYFIMKIQSLICIHIAKYLSDVSYLSLLKIMFTKILTFLTKTQQMFLVDLMVIVLTCVQAKIIYSCLEENKGDWRRQLN